MKIKSILFFFSTFFCFAIQSENVILQKVKSQKSISYSGSIAPLPTDRLKANGGKIVKPNGSEFITKSLGLGGWLVQEGYMLGASGAQWEIKAFLNSFAGAQATTDFYDSWLNNFVTDMSLTLQNSSFQPGSYIAAILSSRVIENHRFVVAS